MNQAAPVIVTTSIVGLAAIAVAFTCARGRDAPTAPPTAAMAARLRQSDLERAWTTQREARAPAQPAAGTRPDDSAPAANGCETADVPDRGPAGTDTAGGGRGASAGGRTGAQSGWISTDSAGAAIRVDTALPARATDSLFGSQRNPNSWAADQELSAAAAQARADGSTVARVDPDLTYDSGPEAQFPTATRFQVPDSGSIAGDAGAISFALEPQWSGDNQADADLVAVGDNQLRIFKNVHFLRFEMTDNSGSENGTGANIADWEPVEPHEVTATWGGGLMSLYIDAKLVAQQRYTSPFEIPSGTPVYVGTDSQGALVAPAVLSNVRLSKQSLGPSEIASRSASASQPTN